MIAPRICKSKRGQGSYEMIMLITGIILIVTVFAVVFVSRSSIPEPNLPAKTVVLSEKTFNIFELAFKMSAVRAVQQSHLDNVDGFGDCQVIVSSSNQNVAQSTDDPIAGYILVDNTCLYPKIITTFTHQIEKNMNTYFGLESMLQTYNFNANSPERFILLKPATEFSDNQFKATLVLGNGKTPYVQVVSRKPLTINANAPFKNDDALQWRFSAQRVLQTDVALKSSDTDFLQLISNLDAIKAIANSKVVLMYQNHNPDDLDISETEKAKLIDDIRVALLASPQLSFFEQRTQLNINYYFSYNMLIHKNRLYFLLPNPNVVIELYNFD